MPYSLLERVGAHVQSGDMDAALRLLDQQLSQHPEDDESRRWRVAVLMHLPGDERQQAALADLDAMRAPIADDTWRRSIALQTLGDLNAAEAVVLAALEQWPGDEQLIERQLYLLMLAGKRRRAQALLDRLPRTWRWLTWAGELATESARDADAIAIYTEALADLERSLDTSDPFAANIKAQFLLSRAQVQATAGAFAEADADYAAVEAIVPNDPMIRFKRGLLASLQGDLIQALSLCGDSLTTGNDNEQAQMEHILRGDPRYAALAMLILQGDADI